MLVSRKEKRMFLKKIYNKLPDAMKNTWRKYKKNQLPTKIMQAFNANTPFFAIQGGFFTDIKIEELGYFSQYGQDLFLDRCFFNGKNDGVFIDIGANDPIILSNTLFFEKKGWTGLAFEPQIALQTKWNCRKTVCLPIALGECEKEITFCEVPGKHNYLSHVVTDTDKIKGETTRVKQRRLTDVLLERNLINIDFVSLDVEGYEMNVLNGIDFDRINIKVFVIENNNNHPYIIQKYMKKKGYRYIGRLEIDDFFVKD